MKKKSKYLAEQNLATNKTEVQCRAKFLNYPTVIQYRYAKEIKLNIQMIFQLTQGGSLNKISYRLIKL